MATRVLITGGGGFIGRHLVDSQLSQGHWVRVADLNVDALSNRADHPRLEALRSDITKPETVRAVVEGVDIVYHLASAHLDVNLTDETYRKVNVEATVNLVHAARSAGVRRVVHCSSAGVFGHLQVPPPADENTPCHPTHIYEISKLEGERAILSFSRRTGFPVVVARPAWVYGPGCPRTLKLLRMIAKGRFVMFGNGRTLRQPLYVEDAVRGLERCAQDGKSAGQVYILAGRSFVTIEELVQLVGEAQGVQPKIIHLPAVLGQCAGYTLQFAYKPLQRQPPFSRRSMDFFLKHNLYDTGRASRELGFEAEIDLREGLRLTVTQLNGTHRYAEVGCVSGVH
jgi:dihydroflavonol-4-reductase